MRHAKLPPYGPWARLSEYDHRWWWYAHLHELAAIVAAAHIESGMRRRELTPNLNFVGRFVIRWKNECAIWLLRKSYWRYERGLTNAKHNCPWALHEHYMTTPFESQLRLVEDLNPGMFNDAMKAEKASAKIKALDAG